MLDFRPLASSSSGNCYIVSAPGEAPLLIDCGVRFEHIQKALKFKVGELAGCLVSHAHGDHSASIPSLLTYGVDVYASEGTWFSYAKGAYAAHHRARQIQSRDEVQIGPYLVMPFEVVHDAEETFGFLISAFDDKLLYLTDTAYSKYVFPGLTMMAVECNWGEEQMKDSLRRRNLHPGRIRRTVTNHMSLERLLRLMEKNDLSQVREIWLLHLSDANSDEVAFKEAVQRATGKPVYIATKHQKEVPF